jgi:serralysin
MSAFALPSLTAEERAEARPLTLAKAGADYAPWDNSAFISGVDHYALLHSRYSFTAIAGASYTISSLSYFDPFVLMIYGSDGAGLIGNDELDDGPDVLLNDGEKYGIDTIFDWIAPYSGTFYTSASWDQGQYYTYYSLAVYEDIDTVPARLRGGATNETFTGIAGNETLNGGAGRDKVVYSAPRADFAVLKLGTGFVVTDQKGTQGTDLLLNMERLQFSDQNVAFDIAGVGGQSYRIYQAAFNRIPDLGGLGYWMAAMDGGMSLTAVANQFVTSAEFKSIYGNAPTNLQLVTKFYENLLHRAPEAAGRDFWAGVLDRRDASVADVLAAISESQENQDGVIGLIGNGIAYLPWGSG